MLRLLLIVAATLGLASCLPDRVAPAPSVAPSAPPGPSLDAGRPSPTIEIPPPR